MPTQVLPITDLAKAGVIRDTPSVSLPPNVFSDCRNVRFRDGAIRKMEGEREILLNIGRSDLIFVAWWPIASLAPNDGYYVVVGRTDVGRDLTAGIVGTDTIYLFQASDLENPPDGGALPVPMMGGRPTVFTAYTNTFWQHTLFGGGSTFIINNRTETPKYIIDPTNGFFDLPGWDSYLVDEQVTSFFYDTAFITDLGTDLGSFVQLPDSGTTLSDAGVMSEGDQDVLITVIPADTRIAPFNLRVSNYQETIPPVPDPPVPTDGQGAGVAPAASVGYNTDTGTTFVTFAERRLRPDGTVYQQGVLPGDSVTIRIQTAPEIQVRAGVIRTYGDLLVAGNLTEMERSDPTRVVRNMPGVIRTSDVAAPGSVPANWNPFKTGVNTADEFTLSSTGIIQDMVELQGVLYVYTNESIHSVQNTGNPSVPFNIRPVAKGWGAQTIDAVQEFDGKHLVIGSGDIYVFAGHPGSIQSIADLRVRREFFTTLNPTYEQNLFTFLYRRRDEIWINYPTTSSTDGQCDRTLIWNYRNNTWTIREQTPFWTGVVSPVQADGSVNPNQFFPLLTSTDNDTDTDSIFVADAPNNFTRVNVMGYPSYVERLRLAMTPEFTTENLLSVAMLTEGAGATLDVMAVGTDTPSVEADFSMGVSNTFNIDTDYKVDLREHGRLLNHRITDNSGLHGWAIVGLQFDIGSGGTR